MNTQNRAHKRAPAHLLKTYTVRAVFAKETGETLADSWIGDYVALTSTGAIVQAAHSMARQKESVTEITATLKD